MDSGPRGGAWPALILAHVVCCGGLVLVATGAVGGLGAWLLDSGLAWLGAGGIAIAALLPPSYQGFYGPKPREAAASPPMSGHGVENGGPPLP